MKNNPFKYFVFLMLSLLMATMAGCTEDDISMPAGQLPDETPMNSVGGQLYSGKTLSNKITVSMYEDDGAVTEEICYALTKPATTVVTVKAIPSPELVAKYNSDNETDMKEFPAANVTLGNGGSLTVAAGKKESGNISITLSPDGLEPETLYLLAIALTQNPVGVDAQENKQVIYYRVSFREKTTMCEPDEEGQTQEIPPLMSGVTTVFYVNTETYSPLIAGVLAIRDEGVYPLPPYSRLGHIVNLKRATIGYDAVSQRALLASGSDLSYVLEHRDKYIRHLQEIGSKVCICIENGGKGIGFCNMNDAQIADFVYQVKSIIERYYLDGVNLWDDDSKYGKAGMPAMNTTSYPKLIKALREALPDKLLTLVDKGEATEYFYDVNKCGGIEAGRYLDYVWHGYFSPTEVVEAITPNPEGIQIYSKYSRKPIAELDPACYGSVNIPCYSDNNPTIRQLAAENIAKWKAAGYKKSNIIVYGGDLIGTEYGGYEQAVKVMLTEYSFQSFMDEGDSWNFVSDELVWGNALYGANFLDYQLKSGPDKNPYRKDW
ncbi:DUF1735 domain-containing protein [Bacteroides sp. HF-5092]|uniref:BT_3987 domain-containing protein n=1 Tax=Bacteroides TaxID=816 RepID=UPI001177F997|nr:MULTISPECIES: DUF1735 domain-containing protein [Bacteroides]TRX47374.1 DUF1735 domain-containing protein [Bacteroides sp. HF-5092]